MTVIKCDKCGEICSERESRKIGYDIPLFGTRWYDICPTCNVEFKEFMNFNSVYDVCHKDAEVIYKEESDEE